jgi:hypothetical protein
MEGIEDEIRQTREGIEEERSTIETHYNTQGLCRSTPERFRKLQN